MGWQGIGLVPSTIRLLIRTGDTDQLLHLLVVGLYFGVVDGPVGSDPKVALHLHCFGIQAVSLAIKVQRTPADGAHMVIVLAGNLAVVSGVTAAVYDVPGA